MRPARPGVRISLAVQCALGCAPFALALVCAAVTGQLVAEGCSVLTRYQDATRCESFPLGADLASLALGLTSSLGAVLFFVLDRSWRNLSADLAVTGAFRDSPLSVWRATTGLERLLVDLVYAWWSRLALLVVGVTLSWILYRQIVASGIATVFLPPRKGADPAIWWAHQGEHPAMWAFFMSVGSIGFYFAIRTVLIFMLGTTVIGRLAVENRFELAPPYWAADGGWLPIVRYLDKLVYGILLATISVSAVAYYIRADEVLSAPTVLLTVLLALVAPALMFVAYHRWRGSIRVSFDRARERAMLRARRTSSSGVSAEVLWVAGVDLPRSSTTSFVTKGVGSVVAAIGLASALADIVGSVLGAP